MLQMCGAVFYAESSAGCIEFRKVDSVLRSVEEEELGWVHWRAFIEKINRIQDMYQNNSNNLEATFLKLSEKHPIFYFGIYGCLATIRLVFSVTVKRSKKSFRY